MGQYHFQGSESVSNDDLVTVVEGQHEEQALSVPQDEAKKNQVRLEYTEIWYTKCQSVFSIYLLIFLLINW